MNASQTDKHAHVRSRIHQPRLRIHQQSIHWIVGQFRRARSTPVRPTGARIRSLPNVRCRIPRRAKSHIPTYAVFPDSTDASIATVAIAYPCGLIFWVAFCVTFVINAKPRRSWPTPRLQAPRRAAHIRSSPHTPSPNSRQRLPGPRRQRRHQVDLIARAHARSQRVEIVTQLHRIRSTRRDPPHPARPHQHLARILRIQNIRSIESPWSPPKSFDPTI